ncbi:MAG: ATP-binding protein, partial [Pseudolabrys sp.]|nr:ATP-binding protein [Pseudolabrys sp.]
MTEFSPQQDNALKLVSAWLKSKPSRNDNPPIFRLFGYAGTGKT